MASLVAQVGSMNISEEDSSIKTVVEERIDDQGRKVRVTRKIRLCRVEHRVPKAVAERRAWPKYGDSAEDKPGPNLATTIIGEAVFLKLAMNRNFDKEAAQGQTVPVVDAKSIVCQYCEGGHWTAKCPYKATFASARAEREKAERDGKASPEPSATAASAADGKYVPPSMRGKGGESMENLMSAPKSDAVIRLSNLSDIATEGDLRALCSVFGPLARVYVAKDHRTFRCRGFAYVTFESKSDAERALPRLNGHRYGNLILKADWSEPQQP